jgi:hypothetical protein
MSQQDIKARFISFVAEHPQTTFEEWIGALHPENTHDSLLKGFAGVLDHKYYEEASEHRRVWNGNLAGTRSLVPARAEGSDCGSGEHGVVIDLLGDSESGEMQVVMSPPHHVVEPGQDLLSFD